MYFVHTYVHMLSIKLICREEALKLNRLCFKLFNLFYFIEHFKKICMTDLVPKFWSGLTNEDVRKTFVTVFIAVLI